MGVWKVNVGSLIEERPTRGSGALLGEAEQLSTPVELPVRAWVGVIIGAAEAFFGDVGVDLGGGEGGVAEEGLDGAEVGAVVEEVGGEGVPKFVGGDVEGDGGEGEVFFENRVEGAGREALAELGEEEGAFGNRGCTAVFLHREHGVGTDGDESFF